MATDGPKQREIDADFTFDLDTAERERIYTPFVAKIDGKLITLTDPAELPMELLMEIDHPVAFLEHCVPKEHLAHVEQAMDKMEGWRFNMLMERYNKHYGIGKRGNSRASRT